ncbi:ABC transporter permease [Flexibacterium corallicola]|uniref:ABC transporter permease n=1 Tax=Flexibacterium corallicola TaxID=3037259 RepID=UPI00286F4AF0|nr:ABC transporter permease [Pseudovibrio sp. M1P-2-3]
MSLLRLAWLSLWNRKLTVGLTVLSIALSVTLFLGVEKVRVGAKSSFTDTISGTDLIVGARTGSVQLLLYSVFRIGNATNNITWQSYQDIANRREVDWMVPMSLGDSHRGFRVMGTTADFFKHYKYRGKQSFAFASGSVVDGLNGAVVGADVAKQLGYTIGQKIIVSHGLKSFIDHDDNPFRVTGILKKTGTPVDRTVIVSLEAIDAIHSQGGHSAYNSQPTSVTAALVGVKSRLQIFKLQRWINEYSEEPLLAIIPGVALSELWTIMNTAEKAIIGVSLMVIATAFLGMVAMIFSSLNERRREMATLRAVGARPRTIIVLLSAEAALMSLFASLLGLGFFYIALLAARSYIDTQFGIYLEVGPPTLQDLKFLGFVIIIGTLAGLAPALRAYRVSLADGMRVRA